MLFETIYPHFYVLTYATWDISSVWAYMLPASLLWGLAFFAYLIGQHAGRQDHSLSTSALVGGQAATIERAGDPNRPGEVPGDWMVVTGIILILAGILGLVLTTGSLKAAFSLGGLRSSSTSILVTGTYRYTVWMQGAPIGAGLVWYYVTQRRPMGRLASALWVIILYAPLFPFYLYTAGRSTAIFPLLLLIALYYRYTHRFSGVWIIVAFVVLLPILSGWSLYRAGNSVAVTPELVTQTAANDTSRYDVSVISLAGFSQGKMPYYLGETFITAAHDWLPGSLKYSAYPNGTGAQAQSMAGTRSANTAASYATSFMTESYLNFGILGVAVLFFLYGRFIRLIDRHCRTNAVLTYLLLLSLAYKTPFATTLSQSVDSIIYGVGVPLIAAVAIRSLLRSRPRADMTTAVYPMMRPASKTKNRLL